MINIFYNTNYIKTKKVFLTKSFKHSKFLNLYIDILYFFNIPIQEKFILSGPHKRMNNLVRAFEKDSNFSFNKDRFQNNYIVQFDQFGENILKSILRSNNNSKILIGPLYNLEFDQKLTEYINLYPNIKKVVASDIAYKNAVYEMGHNIDKNNVVIFPSGVISKAELERNKKNRSKEVDCLIYFKKRPHDHLKLITNFLKEKDLTFNIFEYGKYSNVELKNAALKSKFGIFMSRPETQGFAAQELLACNLPLLVWDQKKNFYADIVLSGTTMSYWSDDCGLIFDNYDELESSFNTFIKKLDNLKPYRLIEEKLTYEVFKSNLIEAFNNFD